MGLTKYGPLVAKIYDPLLAKGLDYIRRRVAFEAKMLGVKTVIDLCCGTGHQLSYFKPNDFEKAVGIDLSPHMVKESKKYNVECKVGDATATRFDDNSFDMSMVSFALHEKDWNLSLRIVEEARRITKNQGYFFVVDYVYDGRTKPRGKLGTWIIEFFAGGKHFRNFRHFIKSGGLDNLVVGMPLLKDIRFVSGAVALRIYRVEK